MIITGEKKRAQKTKGSIPSSVTRFLFENDFDYNNDDDDDDGSQAEEKILNCKTSLQLPLRSGFFLSFYRPLLSCVCVLIFLSFTLFSRLLFPCLLA